MSSSRKMKRTARKSMHSVLENRLHVIENIELLQDSTIVRNVNVKEVIRQQKLQQTQQQTKKTPSHASPLLGRSSKMKEPSTPTGKLHPAVASLKRTHEKQTPEDTIGEDETMIPAPNGLLQCIGIGGTGKEKASNIPVKASLSAKKGPALRKKQATPKPKKRHRLSVGSKSPGDLSIKKSKKDDQQKTPEIPKDTEAAAGSKDENPPHNDSSISDIFRKTPPEKKQINIISPSGTQRSKQVSQKTPGRVNIVKSTELVQQVEKKIVDEKCEPGNSDVKKEENGSKAVETGGQHAGKSKVSVVSLGSQVSFIRTSTPASLMDSGLTQFGASLSIIRSETPTTPPKADGKGAEKVDPVKATQGTKDKGKSDNALEPQKKQRDSHKKQKQTKVADTPSSSLERHKRSYSDSDLNPDGDTKKALQMKHGAAGRKSLKINKCDDQRSSKGTPHKIRNRLSSLKISSTSETSSEGSHSSQSVTLSKKHKSTSQKKQHATESEEKLSEKIKRKATDMLHAVTGRTPQKSSKRKSTEVISEVEVKRSPPPSKENSSEVADCCVKAPPCMKLHAKERSPLKESDDTMVVHDTTSKHQSAESTATEILDDAPSPVIPVVSESRNPKTNPFNLFKLPPEPMKSTFKTIEPSVKPQKDPVSPHSPQRLDHNDHSESDVVMSSQRSDMEPELQFDYPRKSHPVFPGIKPIVEAKQDEEIIGDSEDTTGDEVVDGNPRLVLKLKKTSSNVYALSWQEKEKNTPNSTPKNSPNIEAERGLSTPPITPTVALDSKLTKQHLSKKDHTTAGTSKRKQATPKCDEQNPANPEPEENDPVVSKEVKSGAATPSGPQVLKSDSGESKPKSADNKLVKSESATKFGMIESKITKSGINEIKEKKSGSVATKLDTVGTKGAKAAGSEPSSMVQRETGLEKKTDKPQEVSGARNIFEMLSSDCQKPVEEKKADVQQVPHGCIQDGLVLKILPLSVHICSHALALTITARFTAHGLELCIRDASLSIAAQDTRSIEVYFGMDHTTLHYQVSAPSSYRLLHLLAKLNIATVQQAAGIVSLTIRFSYLVPMVMMQLTQLFQHMVPTPPTVTLLTSDRDPAISDAEQEHTSVPPRQPDGNQSVVVDDSALPSFAKAKAIFEQKAKIITPMLKAQPYGKKKSRCWSEGGITLGEPDNRELVLESKRRNSEDQDKTQETLNPALKGTDTMVRTSEVGKIDHHSVECQEKRQNSGGNENNDTSVATVLEGKTKEPSTQDNEPEMLADPIEMKETLTSQAKVVLLQRNSTENPEPNKEVFINAQSNAAENKKADSLVKGVLLHKPTEESTTTTDDSGVSSTNMSDRTPCTPSMESSKKHDSNDTWSMEKSKLAGSNTQVCINKCGLGVRIKNEGIAAEEEKDSGGVKNSVDFAIGNVQSVTEETKIESVNTYNSPTTQAQLFVISPEESQEEEEETPSAIMSSALQTVQEYHPTYRKDVRMDFEKQNPGKESKILKLHAPPTPGYVNNALRIDRTDTNSHQNLQENQASNIASEDVAEEFQTKSNVDSNQKSIDSVDKESVTSSEAHQVQRLSSEGSASKDNDLPQRQSPKVSKQETDTSQKQSASEACTNKESDETRKSTPAEVRRPVRRDTTTSSAQEEDDKSEVYEKIARDYYDSPSARKLLLEKAKASPTGGPMIAFPAPGTPVRIVRLEPTWNTSPAAGSPTPERTTRNAPTPPCHSAILEKSTPNKPTVETAPCQENVILDRPTQNVTSQLTLSSGNVTLDRPTLDASAVEAMAASSSNALKALTKLFTDAQQMQAEAMSILQHTVMQNYNQVQKLRDELKAERARRCHIENMLREMQQKQQQK